VNGRGARFSHGVDFEFGGSAWRALPQRAALWLDRCWLLVADLHFGKSATFRARGVPVPAGTTQADLARLTALIEATRARRLVFSATCCTRARRMGKRRGSSPAGVRGMASCR